MHKSKVKKYKNINIFIFLVSIQACMFANNKKIIFDHLKAFPKNFH